MLMMQATRADRRDTSRDGRQSQVNDGRNGEKGGRSVRTRMQPGVAGSRNAREDDIVSGVRRRLPLGGQGGALPGLEHDCQGVLHCPRS